LIMTTSNHNFVNLLVIVLCIFLLDDRFISRFMPGRLIERVRAFKNPGPSRISSIVLGVVAVIILVTSTGTFVMRTLPVNYPAVVVRPFAAVYNYGIGHIFHVYPVMQVERQELEIQGSNDGINWRSYGFRYKPGPVNKRPPVNIPHQPRLDWMMWFLPPQARGDDLWLNMLLRRLHEGSPQVLQLFEYNPFPDKPPRFLRVVAYNYRFTTPEEKAATGNWWQRSYLGVFPYVEPRRP